jgi:O-antigen ligase/polysaccharide polymerase Wzy-like membrane protein
MRRLAYLLSMALVFSVPWEAGIQISALGRGSKLLGFVAAAVWLVSLLGRGRVRALDRFHHVYFLFLVWSGLTLFWSIDTHATTIGFLTYVQIFLMAIMVWDLFDTRRAIDTAVQMYVLGAYVTAGSLILKYLTSPGPKCPVCHSRLNALGYQTDGIALICAIAAPAAWYLAMAPGRSRGSQLLRIVNAGYLPVGLMGIALTGTRGATLASIPTALLIIWSLRHATRRLRRIALVTVAGAVLLLVGYAPSLQLNRIATTTSATQLGQQGSSLGDRWYIWVASTHVFLEHPFVGVGVDSHRAAVAPLLGQQTVYKNYDKKAHNTYLSVLVETGMVGFVLLLALILSIVRRVRGLTGWDRWYWSTQLGVIAIGAMSLSLEESKSIWIFMSLAIAAAATQRTAPVLESSTTAARVRQSLALATGPGRP